MLRDALNGLFGQVLRAPLAAEILVVDNNCTDSTPALIDELSSNSPWPLRRIVEKKQGVSYARNSGIREARGELVAFLDDDILPEKDWLQGMVDVFDGFQADAAGGRISPLFLQEPPAWFKDPRMDGDLDGVLGRLALSPEAFVTEKPRYDMFYGANMAFRKSVFDEVGYFREDLGIVAGKRGLSEETEMLRRLLKHGKRIAYTPHAHVWHKITPRMMTEAYVRKWKYNKGVSVAIAAGARGLPPAWLLKECLGNAAASFFKRLGGDLVEARKREYQ
ncbi:MAG TPA: glycosyltransferase, partial [Verrucomicrobiae bacterium]|nr:glycosyltransferase [Verrucomicrobiae bacterium]